ncbi:MAG: bifunctional sugar phosphate isomerase/epimerase/4-hydroxyphenylpyruvate dioxygenase family protein [Actinomycetes bacterium]
MRKSIATVCLSGTLEEKLAAVARAGFDGVEVFENDLLGCPVPPAEIRRRAADLGLTVEMYQPFRDFEAVTPDVLAGNLRRAEHKLDVMEDLGASTLLVCSNVSREAVDDDDLAASQLSALADRAARRGMRIAYEALAWGRHVDDYRRTWSIVSAADHPHLGVCLDSFHILSRGHDPAAIADIPGEKVFFVQLADAPRMAMDVLPWSRHHRCFPGQGAFDLAGFLRHVVASGYRGPLSLEVFNDLFRHAEANRTAVDAMRSLLFLEESLRSRLQATTSSTGAAAEHARERVELFDPPSAPPLTGYAFVELGVGNESRKAAEDQLQALGFGRGGRHRSKAVDLWRQGDLAVLLTTEPDATVLLSDPGSLPGLVALGLTSTDPVASANRAEALRAPAHARRIGRGEADLPTVETPEGTALLFCPSDTSFAPSWLDDFDLTRDPPPGPLTTVDHVVLSVDPDRLDEGALFSRAVLGMQPRETHELADPHGLVNSRALEHPTGTFRLALNTATLGRSRHEPAQTPHPSYGMQHIAFGCHDIVATLRCLREQGMRTLPIPDNYYDDLRSRTGLPEQRIATLQDLHVLYDSDGDGEYLHAFTPTVGRRLFFELVQRVDGYTGYGASNATIRMTAQFRERQRTPQGLPATASRSRSAAR